VLKRVVQRYLLATIAFLVALVWTGLDITAALECLVVFSAVYLAAAAVQQRTTHTRNARRRRPRRRVPRSGREDEPHWAR
jgi:hypothetical protein